MQQFIRTEIPYSQETRNFGFETKCALCGHSEEIYLNEIDENRAGEFKRHLSVKVDEHDREHVCTNGQPLSSQHNEFDL